MSNSKTPLVLSAEPYSTPTRVDLPEGVAVVQMRHSGVALSDLPGLFDGGFSVLSGLGPIGPGYAIYEGDVSGVFDLTIGFPVAGPPALSLVPRTESGQPADLPDGVEHASFPSGPALVLSHLGSFEGLGTSWPQVVGHPDARQTTRIIELYVTDPSQTPVDQLRTDLILPLD